MRNSVPLTTCLLLIAATHANAVAQESAPVRPNARAHFRFKDGKVLVAESLYGWDGSGSAFYTPRWPRDVVELDIGDQGSAGHNPGSFLLRIPLARVNAISSLPKPQTDSRRWSIVEMQLRDGSKVSGRLRGDGWTGRAISPDGLEQIVTLKQEEVKAAEVQQRAGCLQLAVEDQNGRRTLLTKPNFVICEQSLSVGENLSGEMRIGSDENRLTLIPIPRIQRISPLRDAQGNVVVELTDGKSVKGPLRSGIYASGSLRYGKGQEVEAELLFRREAISVCDEILFAEPGQLSSSGTSSLAWTWPKEDVAAPAKASKPPPTRKTHKPDPSEVNREKAAEAKLRLAKNLLQTNRDAAKKWLREIVKDFDGTEAAKEAVELLNTQ